MYVDRFTIFIKASVYKSIRSNEKGIKTKFKVKL